MPDDFRRPAIDKSHLPSRHVTVGPERAPHRAFLYSMGLTEEQIAQAAKKGVAAARGTPREFTTCGGLFTANTMACVSEAIGLALPGSAGAPAPYASRDAFGERAY